MRDEFASFDSYWDALLSDTEEWRLAYNRANSGSATETTLNAWRLLRECGSINPLLTNAIPYPARKPRQIRNRDLMEELGRQIFRRLAGDIRPKVVVFHGNPAIKLGQWFSGEALDRAMPVDEQAWSASLPNAPYVTRIYAIPHLCGAGAPKGYSFEPVYERLPHLIQQHVAQS